MHGIHPRNVENRLKYGRDEVNFTCDGSWGVIRKWLFALLRVARHALPISIAVWSILELPLELILTESSAERLASLIGRVIWVAFAIGTTYQKRFATNIFLFLCAVGSVVVAQALPMAYQSSVVVFSVLLMDLILKTSTLLASLVCSLIGLERY
ncbi:hypothetical protein [Burkholderia sp. Ac-20365]|uniref:hypothetical protein n=1 Tax=Burkholderia sp. Ac-20365 TaxID=2703897 RepID=UPI00197B7699|nr:hypothetical protein [Burkholderia sp. Ac-20365]MBN3759252.1 hypothetical protein [Burkholderia sp. Ac-20365]